MALVAPRHAVPDRRHRPRDRPPALVQRERRLVPRAHRGRGSRRRSKAACSRDRVEMTGLPVNPLARATGRQGRAAGEAGLERNDRVVALFAGSKRVKKLEPVARDPEPFRAAARAGARDAAATRTCGGGSRPCEWHQPGYVYGFVDNMGEHDAGGGFHRLQGRRADRLRGAGRGAAAADRRSACRARKRGTSNTWCSGGGGRSGRRPVPRRWSRSFTGWINDRAGTAGRRPSGRAGSAGPTRPRGSRTVRSRWRYAGRSRRAGGSSRNCRGCASCWACREKGDIAVVRIAPRRFFVCRRATDCAPAHCIARDVAFILPLRRPQRRSPRSSLRFSCNDRVSPWSS